MIQLFHVSKEYPGEPPALSDVSLDVEKGEFVEIFVNTALAEAEKRDVKGLYAKARRGEIKHDDLLEKVRVARLRRQIADAGLRIVREELHATATVRRLPAAIGRWLRDSALTQDALISNMEYVLARGPGSG